MDFILLCVIEHGELVRVMANFWLSCALAASRTPFAMTYYNRLQPAENRPMIAERRELASEARPMIVVYSRFRNICIYIYIYIYIYNIYIYIYIYIYTI